MVMILTLQVEEFKDSHEVRWVWIAMMIMFALQVEEFNDSHGNNDNTAS